MYLKARVLLCVVVYGIGIPLEKNHKNLIVPSTDIGKMILYILIYSISFKTILVISVLVVKCIISPSNELNEI